MSKIKDLLKLCEPICVLFFIISFPYILEKAANSNQLLYYIILFIVPITYIAIYLYKNLRYNKIKQVQIKKNKLEITHSHFFTKKTIEITLNSLEKIASESCEQELVFTSSTKKLRFLIANKNKKEIIATLLKLDCPFYYELPKVILINSIETVDKTVKLHTSNNSIIGTKQNTLKFTFDEIKAIHLYKPYLFKKSKGKATFYIGENKAHIFKFYKGKDNKIYNDLIALKKELGIYYG